MKYIIVFCFVVQWFVICAQNHQVDGIVIGLGEKTVYLAMENKDGFVIIDTTVSKNDEFSFEMTDNRKLGVYRVYLNDDYKKIYIDKSQYISFIYSEEDVVFESKYNFVSDSLSFKVSTENKLYNEFLKKENEFLIKLSLLHPLILNYPKQDKFYSNLKNQYLEIQQERNDLIFLYKKRYLNKYMVDLVSMHWSPFTNPEHDEREMLEYKKNHYFDSLDFSSERILNSNSFSTKIIDYIMLYSSEELSPLQQEDEFIKAISKILLNTNNNSDVYEYTLDYLIRGFEKFKMERVLNYIYENYLSENSCEADNKEMLKTRLQAYNQLSVGKIAPDIKIKDVNGEFVDIEKMNSEYLIIVFWASWCPHCKDWLKKLEIDYTNNNIKVDVLTISIDTVKLNWINESRNFPKTWRNCIELKGWGGESVVDYNVFATPTIFVLNKRRKIIAKPITYSEFIQKYRQLFSEK